jgi:hypothetical protein
MPRIEPNSTVTKNALWDNNTRCAFFATSLFREAVWKKYSVCSGARMGISNMQPHINNAADYYLTTEV